MIKFMEMTAGKVKKYCSVEKIEKLNDVELTGLFHYVNKFLFEFCGSLDVQSLSTRKWWECANSIVCKELDKRGISAIYIGISKGNEGDSAIELLNMKDEDFQIQAYAMLDSIELDGLKRIERTVSKVALQSPLLYQPYLKVVREEISKRADIDAMLN